MNFNCCLDPVIYFFAIKTYKKRVMSLFRDYLYTSGASSKIAVDNSSSNTWDKPQLSLQVWHHQQMPQRRSSLLCYSQMGYFSLFAFAFFVKESFT